MMVFILEEEIEKAYGRQACLDRLQDAAEELFFAITNYKQDRESGAEKLIESLADVGIALSCGFHLVGREKVEKKRAEKLIQLCGRLGIGEKKEG